MTQSTLNYTYKLFQYIYLPYFALDCCKHDVNIHSTFVIHKTALDLLACGTDLSARYGRKEVKTCRDALKSQFKYFFAHISQCFYDVNLLIKRNVVHVNVKCCQQTAGVLQGPKLPTK